MPDYASYQYPLRVAVKARIDQLLTAGSLPGLTSATPCLNRSVPAFTDFGRADQNKTYTWPGIIVSNAQAESDQPANNHQQDRSYVVLVSIATQLVETDPDELFGSTDEDQRLAWRDVLIDNLAPKGITTTTPTIRFYKSEFIGGQVVDWAQFSKDKRWVSSMLFRFTARRTHVT